MLETNTVVSRYLKDGQQALPKAIKVITIFFLHFLIEPAAKNLHSQKGKNNNEQEKQKQQRGNGLNRIQQRGH